MSPLALLSRASLIVGLLAGPVLGGAWTQPRGGGYFKLNSQMVRGDRFYDRQGSCMAIPTLADYTLSLYGEYGLREQLTVVGYLPFFKRITLNKQVGRPSRFLYFKGDAQTGVADADLGVRYRLLQRGGTVLSAGLSFGLPLGRDQQENGLLTGDGEFNQALTLQVGRSFYPLPAYLSAELGVNNRTRGFSDEFLYAAELGHTFGAAFTAIVRLRGVESLKNGDGAVMGGMGGLYANDQGFLAYGTELLWAPRPSCGISFSLTGAARLRNSLSAPALSLGIFTRR